MIRLRPDHLERTGCLGLPSAVQHCDVSVRVEVQRFIRFRWRDQLGTHGSGGTRCSPVFTDRSPPRQAPGDLLDIGASRPLQGEARQYPIPFRSRCGREQDCRSTLLSVGNEPCGLPHHVSHRPDVRFAAQQHRIC